MVQLKSIQQKFISRLQPLYEMGEAEELFWMSVEECLNLNRLKIKLKGIADVDEVAESKLNQILSELGTGKPIQYILGFAWFFNQKFFVNESVLIPRPETEELVALILEQNPQADLTVLDIGTGSGCIPISLKKHLKGQTQVFAIDISEGSLAVANQNSDQLNCPVDFRKVDILEADVEVISKDQQFDIIVSNPPYITPSEKLEMHQNVLDFEPSLALFITEDQPLIFYEAISEYAFQHLVHGGKLYFEINQAYGKEVINLLQERGYQQVELKKDLSGLDRMVSAIR